MASGYEKSPDYGGPEPTRRELLAALAIVAALIVVRLLLG